MKRLIFAALLLSIAQFTSAQEVEIWKDSTRSFDERTDDLIKRLTVDEKIRFFSSDIPAIERLGIPSYMWYSEALHGYLSLGCTSFPQNNAMGATWDRDLMFDVANAISDEARAIHSANQGQVMIYSPTINMARDPRWGRNEECYSEDPYMMAEMAKMYVRGMQGTHPKYLKTVCTIKHYVANNVEHRRERIQSNISKRDLYDYYLPAYKACIVDERAGGVMSALNGLNGVPCSADEWLLSTVLRKEWGFEGYVVADWGAVGGVSKLQQYAPTNAEGSVKALLAGCDQECFRPNASPMVQGLQEAYKAGKVTESELDVSLRRLIKLRFQVNGFWLDDECPYNNTPASLLESDDHKALALKAAERSIVLLKNEKNTLPLKSNIKSIAVVGPFANRCWLGIYSGRPKSTVTPLEGIKARFNGEVTYAQGCAVTENNDTADINHAIDAAKKADVVVAFVGNDNTTSTENRDRQTLALPGRQQQLIDELCKVNEKVIIVLVPSGATTIGAAQQNAEAVLCGWANGQQQGHAIAKVLFGDVNPGGKLNTTWFASDNDLPDMHDYNIRNNRTYMYFKGTPLYPFGYGLSYTSFNISNMKLNTTKLKKGGDIIVSVDVTNSGKVAGDEVVQLYIKDNATKSFEASKMLRGFERVSLKSGETKRVNIKVSYDAFGHWNEKSEKYIVSSGKYEIMVGNSSSNTPLTTTINISGSTLPERSTRTVDLKDYDADPRYRSTYYGGKITMPKLTQPKAKTNPNGPRWVEYMINFVDPGFYVSEWDITVNYKATKPNTKLEIDYDGVKVIDNAKLEKQGNATQALKVPKPDYGMETRLRLIHQPGVEIESIDVIWPKDNTVKRYDKVFDKR